jgi:hypothetical protein
MSQDREPTLLETEGSICVLEQWNAFVNKQSVKLSAAGGRVNTIAGTGSAKLAKYSASLVRSKLGGKYWKRNPE